MERRSVRKYKGEPVQVELMNSLLQQAASLWTSEMSSHWRCLYYDSMEARVRLAESMIAKVTGSQWGKLIPSKVTGLLTKTVLNTPALLVFIAEDAANERQRDENYAAVCSIMQNLQLLGWQHGLGMLWYTEPFMSNPSFFNEIGLKSGERLVGVLNIGYFDKSPKARKRTPAEQNWTELAATAKPTQAAKGQYVASKDVLEALNIAVWAPNDGMREPWHFIYVTDHEAVARLTPSPVNGSPSFLIVAAKKEADPHKQQEDYAAVCCLVQNFQLVAADKGWSARRSIPEWIYEHQLPISLPLDPQERIVAVLEIGTATQTPYSPATSPTFNIARL
ncbi:nitroreductase family protein [Paenibacillus daejeonensis]|uniref:nitroreductase family protein n=1 Tax=Paenibacillus daejeonensis TaxID=135193 RepID=UPI00059446D4|nr:nitroreductase family protein [Paenibacillus daejeonensis]